MGVGEDQPPGLDGDVGVEGKEGGHLTRGLTGAELYPEEKFLPEIHLKIHIRKNNFCLLMVLIKGLYKEMKIGSDLVTFKQHQMTGNDSFSTGIAHPITRII